MGSLITSIKARESEDSLVAYQQPREILDSRGNPTVEVEVTAAANSVHRKALIMF